MAATATSIRMIAVRTVTATQRPSLHCHRAQASIVTAGRTINRRYAANSGSAYSAQPATDATASRPTTGPQARTPLVPPA